MLSFAEFGFTLSLAVILRNILFLPRCFVIQEALLDFSLQFAHLGVPNCLDALESCSVWMLLWFWRGCSGKPDARGPGVSMVLAWFWETIHRRSGCGMDVLGNRNYAVLGKRIHARRMLSQ